VTKYHFADGYDQAKQVIAVIHLEFCDELLPLIDDIDIPVNILQVGRD